MLFVLLGYLLLVVGVVVFSAQLGNYVNLLDQKTSLASAFIGGVLLAAVTSLPELFTSLTSVLAVGKPALVIGNILGSNVFNLFVMGFVFLLYWKGLRSAYLTGSHRVTAISSLVIYGILLFSLWSGKTFFFYGISLISIVIFLLYAFSLRAMSGDEDTGDKESASPLSVKQIVTRFVFYAVLLVITSILITYASDYLGESLGLGTTLAGALLLGIVTSLPEMISCFVLARMNNFNAIAGNILGSCLFNFAIFLVADLAYWNRNLYVYDRQAGLMLILGAVGMLASLFLCFILGKKRENRPVGSAMLLSAVPVACYIAFVFLSA